MVIMSTLCFMIYSFAMAAAGGLAGAVIVCIIKAVGGKRMNRSVYSSSKTDDWATPQDVFDLLNDSFHFTLDPAASESNHKCSRYFTKKQDGLKQSWKDEVVFCNPPYGREIGKWVKKAWEEHQNNHVKIVMLLPARTDTKWFHEYIYHKADIEFIKGRLKFGTSKNSAPFPSMIVVYD